MAKSVCFYFQVHQPFRVAQSSVFTEDNPVIFDGPTDYENKKIFEKVARKCYLPMNKLLLDIIEKHPEFRASFSCSGVFLEQCEMFGEIGEKVLNQFKALAKTGNVEFITETYYHSLSFLHSKLEFTEQALLHHKKVQELFGQKPQIFRNTELIFSDELAEFIRNLGFKGILCEGWNIDDPNNVFNAKPVKHEKSHSKITKKHAPVNMFGLKKKIKPEIKVLTKNYQLSDDIAFRFGDKNWASFPLFSNTYADWIDSTPGDTINLFMDYETFGEHQWEDTGIFDFFAAFPEEFAKRGIKFRTPSETIEDFEVKGEFSAPEYLSWADEHRDLSAWLENDLQKSAFEELNQLEQKLHKIRKSRKKEVKDFLHDFRKLQTSDHLYYMSTKYFADGDVHTYFSPFDTPYDAFIAFMNALEWFRGRGKKLGIL